MIVQYAPVLITTLNRKKHLERCVNSLSKCTGAEKTELIISLDYPPSSDYIEGYNEVYDYLCSDSEWKTAFKKVLIFVQEENLGPTDNLETLLLYANKYYDRVIISEDDNEFSPNFLDFINKGLERFMQDERIIGICAHKDTNWIFSENSTYCYSKLFCAYGVGVNLKKYFFYSDIVPEVLLNPGKIGLKKILKLRKQNKVLFNIYILRVLLSKDTPFWHKGKLNIIDSVWSIYMHLTDTFCVVPNVQLSRTWGNDGSGCNMPKYAINNKVDIWDLDCNKEFDFKNDLYDLKYDEKNYKKGFQYLNRHRVKGENIKGLVGLFVLLLFKFDCEKTKGFINGFRKNE